MKEKSLEEKIKLIHNMQICTLSDEYDIGFYNGLEYALSVLKNRKSVYKEIQK